MGLSVCLLQPISSVVCPKLELHLVILKTLCQLYSLSKCIQLFFTYLSSLLLLFFLHLLLQWSSVYCCLLLTSLLASAVLLLYSILSSIFFETNYSYMMFSLLLLIVLFGHPIFLNIFFCFVSLFFQNLEIQKSCRHITVANKDFGS